MNRAGFLFRLTLLALAFVPVQSATAQDGPSLIILVRHAEKAAVPGSDPPLSEAGIARAKALAASLTHTPVTAIVTSAFKRTHETGSVVAQQRKLTIEQVGLDGGTPAHVAAVAAAVKAKKGVVLVIGHSNTVPAIIAALGGPKLGDICDAHYANMFVLHPSGSTPPSLTLATYGVADPEGAPGCAGMQAR
jgi:phosphohistidine phosphatase SixA